MQWATLPVEWREVAHAQVCRVMGRRGDEVVFRWPIGIVRSKAHEVIVMDEQREDRLVLTVGEAAKLLRVSRSFAYELVAQGEIPVLRLGRRVVVPRAALERFINKASDIDGLPV